MYAPILLFLLEIGSFYGDMVVNYFKFQKLDVCLFAVGLFGFCFSKNRPIVTKFWYVVKLLKILLNVKNFHHVVNTFF